MLRLAKLTDAEYVLDQVAGGLEDYYLGSGEAPGVWAGRLAEQLELAGIVLAEDLRALIEGRHPASGETLIGAKHPTVRAIDATLSAPKSASLLWAFGTPEAASVVSIAHVEAVAAALEFVESRAAVTRRQHAGQRTRASTSGWAVATFVHRTSREGDPQLHTHCIIPNLVQRDDGAWVALDATELYRWAKAAGSVYQEELRWRLTERLGVRWGPDRNGCREMTGISETQLRAFSKRTLQIEAHLAATGGLPEDRKARMHADEAASVATRARKDRTLTPSHLRDRWDQEAALAGLPTGQVLVDALQGPGVGSPIAALEVDFLFARLVDPDVGLCANDARFGEAHVVEAVAAWGAGRLTVNDITDLTRQFLESSRVVRLINTDTSGRAPGQWSTRTHRAVEDRVLDHLALLEKRTARPLTATAVAAAIAHTPNLGDDQIAAVHTLGARPALRALIAPAGHGKTTTLATAVDAARQSGRAVLALSTTNQAVDQLRRVGIRAVTVARFTLDGDPLEPGSIVIVDECSQLPTHEADVVLAAVAECAGGQVWMVGDPLQAQPVRAGGLAPWLAAEIDAHRVVAAQLTENRRQADPIEREALTAFRDGQVETSQELRESQGWEHHHRSREAAVAAMAAAVLTDIDAYGAEHIAALAVTHADCEALADRIRADLTEQDRIGGPSLEGPGWSGPRHYQAGDRMLLHANAILPDGRRLTNGSVATVLSVTAGGLTILPDDDRHAACLQEDFVTRRAPDGRPQVSHAWARTIDGVQGGTWDQVHLLATTALDCYRGYVAQSRSVCPTHTWNMIQAPADDDYGGRLVRPHSTDADQIAAALARANPKTFAANHDPYRIEKAIQDEQAHHRAHLDRRPPDVTERLAVSRCEVMKCERCLATAKERLFSWQERHDRTSGLGRLSPTLRRMRAEATVNIGVTGAAVERAEAALAAATRRYERVRRQQASVVTFDRANQWRIQRIDQLNQQLDDHWSAATVSAARDTHPHAYGPQHLRTARQTLRAQIDGQRQLVAGSPLATTVGDPVQALVDLDQAVAHSTLSPSLPPGVGYHVQPAQGPGIQIMHEHAARLGYTQAAPTPSIQI